MLVDSYKFLPRSFRPLYEGRGAFPGEEAPVWTPFAKRLSESRLALLSSAGIYLKASQLTFDLDREQEHPEWGDPTWRSIPATARPEDIAVAHLHINDGDLLADPEIALPMRDWTSWRGRAWSAARLRTTSPSWATRTAASRTGTGRRRGRSWRTSAMRTPTASSSLPLDPTAARTCPCWHGGSRQRGFRPWS